MRLKRTARIGRLLCPHTQDCAAGFHRTVKRDIRVRDAVYPTRPRRPLRRLLRRHLRYLRLARRHLRHLRHLRLARLHPGRRPFPIAPLKYLPV